MLPTNNNSLLNRGIEAKNSPSKTYYMNFEKNITVGKIDGLEAIKQAVYLILHIERYDFVIYSWNYGIELKDLFGKSTAYVCAVLPSRIQSALLQDDRITKVSDFEVSANGDTVTAKFTVQSSHGTFSQEVSYHV